MKPNFIFIGAAKCGTTWFFKALQAHPEVFVPQAKDIYFFDKNYDRGLAWYESFFDKAKSAKAIGEVSHDYLFSAEAMRRISEDLPGVRLAACIRDPIRRAFSAYLFMRRNGTALDSFKSTLLAHDNILKRGLYSGYLEDCFRIFGRDLVKIFIYDDLQADPFNLAKELYGFLGVDQKFIFADAGKRVLPASKARLQPLASAVKAAARAVRRFGYPGVVGFIKDSPITDLLYKPVTVKNNEMLSDEDYEWLCSYFSEDKQRVEDLLGVSLEKWLERT
jgi:hypothetical protein